MTPIIDLHCDLLSFLAENPHHTPYDKASRVSYPDLQQGGVHTQILALFTETKPFSTKHFTSQLEALVTLQLSPPPFPITFLLAIENASGIAEENEPLETVFQRLQAFLSTHPETLYLSLTWNGENRFGGGCGSAKGLKDEGKRLLEWLHDYPIAIDLSHTSDRLAEDICDFLEKKSLSNPLLASHSNARAICDHPRNLPDFLIREIIRKKGVIGLNFFAPFLGKDPHALARQVEHFLSLEAQQALCFGADFFPLPEEEYLVKKFGTKEGYFPALSNASCYPYALSLLQDTLSLSPSFAKDIASNNFLRYQQSIKDKNDAKK